MSEDRLLDIETTLAYQDDLVGALNKLVAEQQDRISRLEDECRALNQALKELTEAMMAANVIDEKPPHY